MKPNTEMKSTENTSSPLSSQQLTDKAVRTLASSIFQQLKEEGCQPKDIIHVSSELLGLVTTQIRQPD